MYAKALYDNIADTPDELNFNAGDVLEIIAKDYDDNEGWWKCSLGTLEGLVPANFLEELDEDYEAGKIQFQRVNCSFLVFKSLIIMVIFIIQFIIYRENIQVHRKRPMINCPLEIIPL